MLWSSAVPAELSEGHNLKSLVLTAITTLVMILRQKLELTYEKGL